MKRKIVQQGPTTMMISLPIGWVRKYGISKGYEIDIEEKGRELLVNSGKPPAKTKAEIKIDSEDGLYIWRTLQSFYVAGFDEIKVYYTSKTILDKIQESLTYYLIGFEMVSQEKDFCIIKAVSAELDEEFSTVLKRVFQNILQMSETLTSVLNGEKDIEIMRNLERINNRHVIYLRRILIKEKKNDKRTPFLYTIVDYLEKIANEYKYILFDSKKSKKSFKEFVKIYSSIDKLVKEVYDVYYSYSEEKAKKIIAERIRAEKLKPFFEHDPGLTHDLMNISVFIRNVLSQRMILERIKE
ncbi:MAG: hypothetical protein ACE5ES_00275 [Candidatus Nanoarchaeia archaeon]